MDTPSLISILSLAVALTALFIGPWFSHRQAIAEMLQAWIHSLRDSIADFLSLACTPHLAGAHREPDAELPADSYTKLMMLESKIELLLNPKEERQRLLIAAVHDLVVVLHKTKREMSNKQFFDRKAEIELSITAAAQDIIRHEWTRTKRFFR